MKAGFWLLPENSREDTFLVLKKAQQTKITTVVFLMNEPVTTIDPRYSDPNAVATPWEKTHRVLETAELFWLSTVRADGRPHVTQVVAVWLDGALHFCTGVTQQKAVNLRGNPHLILLTGCNHWGQGLDVVVEGFAFAQGIKSGTNSHTRHQF